ncbi:MAG: GNAT family N-acetyltransferase [Halobacteriovoraceae bacterium]|nr:GNAT family N-acetyltransferase [Halobacteriovoraceae bacterium]
MALKKIILSIFLLISVLINSYAEDCQNLLSKNAYKNFNRKGQVIRKVQLKDIPQLMELAKSVFPKDLSHIEDHLNTSLSSPGHHFYYPPTGQVYVNDSFEFWAIFEIGEETPRGAIGLYEIVTDQTEADWIGWYFVDPSYTGRGAGKKLLEKAIEESKKRGKSYLRLDTTSPQNVEEMKAQSIYDRYDFKIIDKFISLDVNDPYEIWYREKKINVLPET